MPWKREQDYMKSVTPKQTEFYSESRCCRYNILNMCLEVKLRVGGGILFQYYDVKTFKTIPERCRSVQQYHKYTWSGDAHTMLYFFSFDEVKCFLRTLELREAQELCGTCPQVRCIPKLKAPVLPSQPSGLDAGDPEDSTTTMSSAGLCVLGH